MNQKETTVVVLGMKIRRNGDPCAGGDLRRWLHNHQKNQNLWFSVTVRDDLDEDPDHVYLECASMKIDKNAQLPAMDLQMGLTAEGMIDRRDHFETELADESATWGIWLLN